MYMYIVHMYSHVPLGYLHHYSILTAPEERDYAAQLDACIQRIPIFFKFTMQGYIVHRPHILNREYSGSLSQMILSLERLLVCAIC